MNTTKIAFWVIFLALVLQVILVACDLGDGAGAVKRYMGMTQTAAALARPTMDPTDAAIATAVAHPTPTIVWADPCTLTFVTCASATPNP